MTIDWWTLGLQTINVVVLIWLLGRVFWRPVAAIIEERQMVADKLLADAEAARTEAEAIRAEIDTTRAGFAKERENILAAARSDAEKARAAILEEAHKQVNHLHTMAKADLDKLADKAQAAWRSRASSLAVDIARRLVSRLDDTAVQNAFLDWLVADLETLPETLRKAVAADSANLEVVTPSALSSAQCKHYQQLISTALGTKKTLTFSIDPDLVGGVAVNGPNFTAESSWRADLTAILKELDDGEKA